MIRVFLTNLGAYNRGSLKGEWIELPVTREELEEAKQRVLAGPYGDEEIFISDHETDIRGVEVHEYTDLEELNELAERLEGLSETDIEVLEVLLDVVLYNFEEALEVLEKGSYSVIFDVYSTSALGAHVVNEGWFGEIPEHLQGYIDYEAIGRDMLLDSWYLDAERGIAVKVD